jgi:hypothetical protein
MFHDLGRLLAHFYLAEEAEQVDRLIEQGTMDEKQASLNVLGMSFEELGIGVARAWNFPERMVQSMRRLPDEQLRQPKSADERLRAIADLSSTLCATIREPDAAARTKGIRALVDKFGKGLGVTTQILESAVLQSITDLKRDATALDMRSADGFLSRTTAAAHAAPQADSDQFATLIGEATLGTGDPISIASPESAQPPVEADRKSLLTAGMQDVTNALVGQYQLNDIAHHSRNHVSSNGLHASHVVRA